MMQNSAVTKMAFVAAGLFCLAAHRAHAQGALAGASNQEIVAAFDKQYATEGDGLRIGREYEMAGSQLPAGTDAAKYYQENRDSGDGTTVWGGVPVLGRSVYIVEWRADEIYGIGLFSAQGKTIATFYSDGDGHAKWTTAQGPVVESGNDENGADDAPGWGFDCVAESWNGAPIAPGDGSMLAPLRLTIDGDRAVIQLTRNVTIGSEKFEGKLDADYRPTPAYQNKLLYTGFKGLGYGAVDLLIDKPMRHAESGRIDLRFRGDEFGFGVETDSCRSL